MPVEVIWNGVARSIAPRRRPARAAGRGTPARAPREDGPTGRAPRGRSPARPSPSSWVRSPRDPAMRRACERKLKAFVAFWRDWQNVEPRVFEDTGISDADAARYSLLLIGGPGDNAVAKRLAGRIPLAVRPDAIVVDGKAFPAADAGVSLVYPSPLNPRALRRRPRRHLGRRPVVRGLAERRVGFPDRRRPQRRRRGPRPARPVPGAGADRFRRFRRALAPRRVLRGAG